jgi:hypothetical protein
MPPREVALQPISDVIPLAGREKDDVRRLEGEHAEEVW